MVRIAPATPVTNKLLDRLSSKDRGHVIGACEMVELSFGQVLEESGQEIRNVYFPTGGFISLLASLDGRHILEVALAGNEGLYGVPVALGVNISPVHALVQGSGTAWRLGPAAFRRELARVPALRDSVNRYMYVVLGQLMQTAACNHFHRVEQRLARWLLMTADRAHASTFRVTHEFLAHMLGVRRVGITEAASALQKRSLIAYKRGLVAILDRKGLERAACGCYRADLVTYERAFG